MINYPVFEPAMDKKYREQKYCWLKASNSSMINMDKSPHILNTSSNLLGICFLLLTSLKVLGKSQQTVIDDITFIAIILFMLSCLLSFLSMRKPTKQSKNLEKIADYIFLTGLSVLFITAILFSFNIIR
jgi:hypothetical protein